jgi:hypothetical protein
MLILLLKRRKRGGDKMASKKDLIIAVLITFCLTTTLFTIVPTKSGNGSSYDPWKDLNDDGVIDSTDLGMLGTSWATTGDPTKNVVINNNVQWYNLSGLVPPKGIVSFNVSTAGYRQASIIIKANNSIPDGWSTFYPEARTGFLIEKSYTFSEWFAITETNIIIPPLNARNLPQIWLDPSYIRIDNPQVGYKFNVTVRAQENYFVPLNVSAWQIELKYGYNLEITRCFEPTWDPEYIFYNKTTMFIFPCIFPPPHETGKEIFTAGALLFPANQTPNGGGGKLCIIEFSIKHLPKMGEQPLILEIDNDGTSLIDPECQTIEVYKYNSIIQWGYDSASKTIQVIGPILIIECYNHNENESIDIRLEIYLTT